MDPIRWIVGEHSIEPLDWLHKDVDSIWLEQIPREDDQSSFKNISSGLCCFFRSLSACAKMIMLAIAWCYRWNLPSPANARQVIKWWQIVMLSLMVMNINAEQKRSEVFRGFPQVPKAFHQMHTDSKLPIWKYPDDSVNLALTRHTCIHRQDTCYPLFQCPDSDQPLHTADHCLWLLFWLKLIGF